MCVGFPGISFHDSMSDLGFAISDVDNKAILLSNSAAINAAEITIRSSNGLSHKLAHQVSSQLFGVQVQFSPCSVSAKSLAANMFAARLLAETEQGLNWTCTPNNWDETWWANLCERPFEERIVISAALIAAELDRRIALLSTSEIANPKSDIES